MNHRSLIENHLANLVETINLDKGLLRDRLVQYGVLSQADLNHIMESNLSRRDRVREVLNFVIKSSSEGFEHFIEALKASDQKHIISDYLHSYESTNNVTNGGTPRVSGTKRQLDSNESHEDFSGKHVKRSQYSEADGLAGQTADNHVLTNLPSGVNGNGNVNGYEEAGRVEVDERRTELGVVEKPRPRAQRDWQLEKERRRRRPLDEWGKEILRKWKPPIQKCFERHGYVFRDKLIKSEVIQEEDLMRQGGAAQQAAWLVEVVSDGSRRMMMDLWYCLYVLGYGPDTSFALDTLRLLAKKEEDWLRVTEPAKPKYSETTVVENVQNKIKDSNMTRLIMEGTSGSGGTPLTRQVVKDWLEKVRNRQDTEETLLLHINLNNLLGAETLLDAIKQENPMMSNMEAHGIHEFALSHSSQVIFILDGYTTAFSRQTSELNSIIRGEKYLNSLCITCTADSDAARKLPRDSVDLHLCVLS